MTAIQPRIIVFDLDGTLVDSIPDLLASGNRIMAARGLPIFTRADIMPMVGDGAGALVRRMMAAHGYDATASDLEQFLADYIAHVADATIPYPGVPETLRHLAEAGWRMAVCTNKPEAPARAVLDALGLLPWFAVVGGGDTYPTRKPDPAHLLHTIHAAGCDPAQAVMVGDHHNDMAAASAAGVSCIFARWGYGQAIDTGVSAETFGQIPEIANRLLPRSIKIA